MSQQIVAIDLQPQGARIARLEASLRRAHLRALHFVPVAADMALSARVQAVAAALKAPAESLIVAVEAGQSSTRLLAFPFTDPRKLDAAVSFELDGQIPYALDQVALAWALTGAGRSGGGADVLTAILPRKTFAAQLSALQDAGLQPRAMVLPTVGLGAYLSLQPQLSQGILAIDAGQSHLALGTGKLAYARTLRWGASHLGAETGVAALAAGLAATLLALPAHLSPRRLLLCGQTDDLTALASRLQAHLGLPVELLDVAAATKQLLPSIAGERGREVARVAVVPQSTDATVVGLALTMLAHGHDVPLNLRRGALAYRGDFQVLRDQIPRLASGVAAVVLAASFAAAVRFSTMREQEKELGQGFCSATQRIVGRPICDPTVALATLRATPGTQSTPIPSYSAAGLLEMVSRAVPQGLDVRLDDLELRVDNGSSSVPERLVGKGEAASFDVAEQLLAALKRDACVQGADLSKQQRTQGGRVSFSLNVKVACPTGVQPGTKLAALSTPSPSVPAAAGVADADARHAGPPP